MSKTIYKIRLKKGDHVMIRSGKYKGHTAKYCSCTQPLTR